MASAFRKYVLRWTTIFPVLAMLALVFSWERELPWPVLAAEAGLLVVTVMAGVHHAELIAHRVGEPFGSLILAVAVTVIEVGLIVMLMVSGKGDVSTLARDTVFSAVMLTMNGIVGISLLVGAVKYRLAEFNSEGTGSALGTMLTLAGLTMVLPRFTTSDPSPSFVTGQLIFAAVASLVLYGSFVFTQTIRHRDFFLPPADTRGPVDDEAHASKPTTRRTIISLVLLVVSLASVVGLAKVESPAIQAGVTWAGLPQSFVGVILAVIVLLPESIAAVRAAAADRTQIALNLGYGSALASIGLTIPVMAVASQWLPGRLTLGLPPLQIGLLALSAVVAVLTVVPGRAKTQHGIVHLVLFAAFITLSILP